MRHQFYAIKLIYSMKVNEYFCLYCILTSFIVIIALTPIGHFRHKTDDIVIRSLLSSFLTFSITTLRHEVIFQ